MENPETTPRAVFFSALLHLGIIAFLALAMLNCADWQSVFDTLRLPASWSPVTCTKPIRLQGEVIEATLVGPVGAPPPAHNVRRKSAPPPEQRELPKPEPAKPAPVKVLPPPPQHPDIKDQQQVAELAQQPAEQAQQAQQEREKQRMAELTREQEAQRILKQLAQVKAEQQANEHQINLAKQRMQQLADLKDTPPKPGALDNVPPAEQARSGQNGQDNDAYGAALQNAITPNWYRPDNIPDGTHCPVEIRQIVGGQVIDVKVLPSCPLDDLGRHSVEAAVRRSSPLPYKGFEKVFQRDITLDFVVPNSQ